MTVTNNGPSNATGVSLRNTLPADVNVTDVTIDGSPVQLTPVDGVLTVPLDTLLNDGPGKTKTVVITVVPTGRAGETLINKATVSGNEFDRIQTNNTATPNTPLASADLTVVIDDGTDSAPVGRDLTYTITVTNNGPDAARGVILTHTLPANVDFRSLTIDGQVITVDVDETDPVDKVNLVGGILSIDHPLLSSTAVGARTVEVVVRPRIQAVSKVNPLISTVVVSSTDDLVDANNRAKDDDTFVISTIEVDKAGDDIDTEGTLRWAIDQARQRKNEDNNNGEPDVITFSESFFTGEIDNEKIIVLTSSLVIDEAVEILATSDQNVLIDASRVGDALVIRGGGSTIQGLRISRYGANGIHLVGPQGGNTIVGNRLGLALVGIFIEGSSGNTIGEDDAERNVIYGNATAGVRVTAGIQFVGRASGNIIAGNDIGTFEGGAGNGVGALVEDAIDTTIGGPTASPGRGNDIAGNEAAGIEVCATPTNTVISGNVVRANATGVLVSGSRIDPENPWTVTIGGSDTGARNVISGNAGAGVGLTERRRGTRSWATTSASTPGDGVGRPGRRPRRRRVFREPHRRPRVATRPAMRR